MSPVILTSLAPDRAPPSGARLARQPPAARRDLDAEAHQLRGLGPRGHGVTVCLFDDDGIETRHRLTEHTRASGTAPSPACRSVSLRLPGRRPVGPVRGPALQPGQAAAGPLRPRGQRRRSTRDRRRSAARRRTTRSARSRARLRAVRAPLGGRRTDDFDWEGRPSAPPIRWRDTVIYELHVKGFTALHPGARELRGTYAGLAHAGRSGPPARPRRHRRRAAAGAPVRHRARGRRSAG